MLSAFTLKGIKPRRHGGQGSKNKIRFLTMIYMIKGLIGFLNPNNQENPINRGSEFIFVILHTFFTPVV